MHPNQYNPQNHYRYGGQAPQPHGKGGVWIILGLAIATILVATVITLALILVINRANTWLEYPKAAVLTSTPAIAATATPTTKVANTTAQILLPLATPTPSASPVATLTPTSVIGTTGAAGSSAYQLPVFPEATRITLSEADDRETLQGIKTAGFITGWYEMYRIELKPANYNEAFLSEARDFYSLELQKLGWNYIGSRPRDRYGVDIYEKGNLITRVIPFLAGFNLNSTKYSYAGIKGGDGGLLVITGQYSEPKPTSTSSASPTPTTGPATLPPQAGGRTTPTIKPDSN